MPPLAGRPPYATDEPDSAFGPPQQPQPRMRQPAPEDPNKRTSAYDVYDNYLKKGDTATPKDRDSGIGNLLLSMGDDSDDDLDDEPSPRPARGLTHQTEPLQIPSKSAALAAAVAVAVTAPPRGASQAPRSQPHQQQAAFPTLPPGGPPSPPRQPIAAPRPGYAAPIAALNGQAGAPQPPPPINTRGPGPPLRPLYTGPPQGSSVAHPHPLQPPITPISPAFIRPSSAGSSGSATLRSAPGVTFASEKASPILRGNKEETLLPSRGEKGDDFWRRFSIVAKEPDSKDDSSWLKKARSRSNRMSRYVGVIGIFLIILILGGVGVGLWLTRNSPGHQKPTAVGGSAGHSMGTSTPTSTANATKAAGGGTSSSIRHISPTNTVARRQLVQPTLVSRVFAKREDIVS